MSSRRLDDRQIGQPRAVPADRPDVSVAAAVTHEREDRSVGRPRRDPRRPRLRTSSRRRPLASSRMTKRSRSRATLPSSPIPPRLPVAVEREPSPVGRPARIRVVPVPRRELNEDRRVQAERIEVSTTRDRVRPRSAPCSTMRPFFPGTRAESETASPGSRNATQTANTTTSPAGMKPPPPLRTASPPSLDLIGVTPLGRARRRRGGNVGQQRPRTPRTLPQRQSKCIRDAADSAYPELPMSRLGIPGQRNERVGCRGGRGAAGPPLGVDLRRAVGA